MFASSSCSVFRPASSPPAPAKTEKSTEFIENISITPYSPGNQPASASAVATNKAPMARENSSSEISGLQFKYGILMDVPVETLTNIKLFSFIDEWYGTPYRFGGNTKDGVDCSAFAGYLVTAVYGMGLPRMARDQYTACERLKKSQLSEGDLVFFHTTRKGISHVGVYLGNSKFVHASLNYGVTISDLNDPYYARTFRGGGRVRTNANLAGN
ncbi:MAG TPA: NlpC/P60 family protein [Mucilaginibacter sp.]|nr:NlpC/P60 family protein [Mucilaginibacter sp.]